MSVSPTGLDRMSDFLVEEMARMVDRGLGDLQVRSNLAWSEESHATSQAAENLLAKARRDLAAGEVERAGSFIDRALRLPFNEMTEAPAALSQAHLMLFSSVSDAFEDSAEDDQAWLDAAEATLRQCGGPAREDLLEILRVLDHDYSLLPVERRRVRALAMGGRAGVAVGDVVHARAGDDREAQRVVVIELLLALTVFEDELARCCGA
jgi:hypothetical protein